MREWFQRINATLGLDHLVNGVALEALVGAPFEWQEGWEYSVG